MVASGLLVLIGLAILYGSVVGSGDLTLFYRQLGLLGLGLAGFFLCAFYNYHTLAKRNRYFYPLILLVLTVVLFFGAEIRGSSRWIDVGFFRFQPAEFIKIVIILGLSRWLYLRRGQINSWGNILLTFCYTAIPAVLIFFEPDAGSTVVVLGLWASILSVSWVEKKYLAGVAVALLLLVGLSWQFVLKDFQRHRVEVFLNPSLDPLGRGYNVRQATIAVGSGQMFGRGLGRGLQSSLRFLPERQTDFVFASLAEEVGFLGSAALLALYGFMFYRIWKVARLARDELGNYVALGVLFMLVIQTTINIGMNVGVLPVTGIPLPLISYGGSSLVVVLVSLGLVQNIAYQSRALRF